MPRFLDRFVSSGVLAGFVVLVVAATFSPVRDYTFVNWDDDVYVTDNPLVQEPSPTAISRMFTEYLSGNYHPLTIASFACETALFGSSARSFHLVNLALHLFNAVLVLLLLKELGTPLPGAAIGALLWAVHPLRAEAVAWISGRKDLLAAFFSLGSILAYLRFRLSGRRRPAVVSVALFALALLSKATTVMIPGLLLAIDWLQGRRLTGAVLREKTPYLLLAAIFTVLAVLARQSYQGVLAEQSFGWQQLVFLGVFRGAFYFLLRSLIPIVNPTWLYPDVAFPQLLSGHFAAAVGFLAVVVASALLSLRLSRKIAFGLLLFFVALLPALPVTVLGYSADRFTYLPAVGIAYLVGELVGWWRASAAAKRQFSRVIAGAVVGVIALFLVRETRVRSASWSDNEALWTTAIREYQAQGQGGNNLAYAFTYRARGRLALGDEAGAEADVARALDADRTNQEAQAIRDEILAARARTP